MNTISRSEHTDTIINRRKPSLIYCVSIQQTRNANKTQMIAGRTIFLRKKETGKLATFRDTYILKHKAMDSSINITTHTA